MNKPDTVRERSVGLGTDSEATGQAALELYRCQFKPATAVTPVFRKPWRTALMIRQAPPIRRPWLIKLWCFQVRQALAYTRDQ